MEEGSYKYQLQLVVEFKTVNVKCFPVSSSRNFRVLAFTFRAVTSANMCVWCAIWFKTFLFFHADTHVFQCHYWKCSPFPYWIALYLNQSSFDSIFLGSYIWSTSGLSTVFINLFVYVYVHNILTAGVSGVSLWFTEPCCGFGLQEALPITT